MFSRVRNQFKHYVNRVDKGYKRLFIKGQHQLTATTSYNRYPGIFGLVKYFFDEGRAPVKILSYGCSTGEECFTLKEYFPFSTIIGVDIYKPNLEKAIKRNYSKDISFLLSTTGNIEKNGPYDIIFVMSVLCRWEDTKDKENCSSEYPFHQYENGIYQFDNVLKRGGVLVIYNSNYCFCDSSFYHKYKPLFVAETVESGFVHKFHKSGLRRKENYPEVIFQKIEG